MKASNEQNRPWWPSSTFGMSYGIARSRFATACTSEAGTNRNSGLGSMKRLMSQGQAIRSTRARSRVTHFILALLSQGGEWSWETASPSPHADTEKCSDTRQIAHAVAQDAEHGPAQHGLQGRDLAEDQRASGHEQHRDRQRIRRGVRRHPQQRDRHDADDRGDETLHDRPRPLQVPD